MSTTRAAFSTRLGTWDEIAKVTTMKHASSRDGKIVDLRSRGLTLQAIAQRFGLTKERVRQITSRYPILPRFTTIPDVTARFGVDRYGIMQALEAAGLKNRQLWQGKKFIFSDQDVIRIIEQLNRKAARKCIQCGNSFTVPIRSRIRSAGSRQ